MMRNRKLWIKRLKLVTNGTLSRYVFTNWTTLTWWVLTTIWLWWQAPIEFCVSYTFVSTSNSSRRWRVWRLVFAKVKRAVHDGARTIRTPPWSVKVTIRTLAAAGGVAAIRVAGAVRVRRMSDRTTSGKVNGPYSIRERTRDAHLRV